MKAIPTGAMTIKAWVLTTAEAEGVTAGAIWMRLLRGKYPHVERLKVGTEKRANYVRFREK